MPEIVDLSVFNPGEEMVVAYTYHRVIFSTPNGVVVKTIFHVMP